MTREIRQRQYPDGRYRTPKYVDHGHLARKAIYWIACVAVAPVAFLGAVAETVARFLENNVGGGMCRLRVWSHPCLYGKGPANDS